MATNNQASEISKYNKLRAGHAEALGIENIDNMTEEQEHALANRLEANGVVKPAAIAALPGTGINPSAGNGEIEKQTTSGRASKKKATAPATQNSVSPANFNSEMMTVLQHFAQQGDEVGQLGMQVFRGAMARQVQSGITNIVLDATQSLEVLNMGADAFLDMNGF